MITFSIITVTYNAENTLPPTIDCVLKQKNANIEHIIVDGASKDNTIEIANEYVEKVKKVNANLKVKFVSEPDNGLYFAMNKGLNLATGNYLLFLNAGDRLSDENTLYDISEQLSVYNENNLPEVLFGDTDLVDIMGNFIAHRRLKTPKYLTAKSFLKGMVVCHQAFFVETALAKQHNYDTKYRFSADFDWCVRVMKSAKQHVPFHKINKVTALYLQEGLTTANHKASLKERYSIMKKHYGTFATVIMHAWFVVRMIFKK